MFKKTREIICSIVISAVATTSFSVPITQVQVASALIVGSVMLAQSRSASAASCDLSDPSTYSNQNPLCVTRQAAIGQMVSYPKFDWSLVGETQDPTGSQGTDIRMISGDATIRLNNQGAQMLNLTGSQISDLVHQFPSNAPIVFARYNPGTAELRIDAVKIDKLPDGRIQVRQTIFSPHQGEMWRVSRAYLSDSEKANPTNAGLNPFATFANPSDDVFHNINFAGVQVAVGHAMRMTSAVVGIIASADLRFDQRTESSGNIFRKKVKHIIEGYAKPQWWIATPLHMQQYGVSAGICVVDENPCQEHHVAISGIAATQWEGGNMPMNEDLLYTWEQTQSSWTVLTFALFTFALVSLGVWGFGEFFAGAGSSAYASTGSALGYGTMAGTGYLGVTALTRGGSTTSAQDGFLGATDNGRLEAPIANNDYERGLYQATRQKQIAEGLNGGLTGTKQFYQGDCPASYTLTQCQWSGLKPGITHRADTYVESNEVLWTKQNGKPQASGVFYPYGQ